jgi:hypothetical protein
MIALATGVEYAFWWGCTVGAVVGVIVTSAYLGWRNR